MLSDIAFIIGTTMMYATPLIYGSLAGVISERAGIVNIGIEGTMNFGCFMGAAFAYITGSPWLGFLAAALGGALVGCMHALATVTFTGNHTVSGIALNLIFPALSMFLAKMMFDGATNTPSVPQTMPKPLNGLFEINSVPELIFNQNATTFIALLLVLGMWFWLYKTKSGLRIRAIGEHPKAADTLGIHVNKTKWMCVIASGILAALGGAAMSIGIVSSYRPGLISGHGFIALAAVTFGKWKPQGAMLACMLFGASNGLVVFLGKAAPEVESALLNMLPYVITLVVLVAFVGSSNGPAASGEPYEKSK